MHFEQIFFLAHLRGSTIVVLWLITSFAIMCLQFRLVHPRPPLLIIEIVTCPHFSLRGTVDDNNSYSLAL